MTLFKEGALQISFPDELVVQKFDGEGHGLTHCMKAVDFIVELDDRFLFIEFKDPDNPMSKETDRSKFMQKFLAGSIHEELIIKYRDSFLYEWATGVPEKPIFYLVLVAAKNLTKAELITRTDDLQRKLPIKGPSSGLWRKQIVDGCGVFNIATWNEKLTHYPITRTDS
jgi:hypothetical protein